MKANDIIKDRYELLYPLGAGGFGEVWLAKDQMTGTQCAIKFYVRLDDAGRSEFRGEYSRMLGITHPNLLTAKYYDEWQGRPFLVMDYCGGGAASDKAGQLGETELWRLIRDVASGLACLHSQRNEQGKEAPVIHQDIKPANFLQKGDGTWLISDFGISSRMRSSMSSQSGREVSSGGTIPYMGPERFGQGKMLVKSSDIWSLGASVFEMATRELPFDEYGGILQKKGGEIPHLPGERWSSDLDRLVSSCLQKETWNRPTAALVAEYADCKLKGKPLPELPREEQARQQAQTSSQTNTSGASLTITANGVSFVMKKVEGGMFWMGADKGERTRTVTRKGLFRDRQKQETYIDRSVRNYDEEAYTGESPVHSVTVSTFYMGETEVTQALWEAVMGSNPSDWKGDNLPVESVSWNDCQEFLRKLNQLTGKSFRLPTEAEWEYAARGGSRSGGTKYAGSSSIGSVAWYDNSGSKTHAVKGKSPNELGLYDMSGNVREWCSDWYGGYDSGSQTNPKGPSSGSIRVLRGGSWFDGARGCRVSNRSLDVPDHRSSYFGFRLCLPQ